MKKLQISRKCLYDKMKRHGIEHDDAHDDAGDGSSAYHRASTACVANRHMTALVEAPRRASSKHLNLFNIINFPIHPVRRLARALLILIYACKPWGGHRRRGRHGLLATGTRIPLRIFPVCWRQVSRWPDEHFMACMAQRGGTNTDENILLAAVIRFDADRCSASGALQPSECDPGEVVIKFSHVVAATGTRRAMPPTMLADRVNKEMNGKACMEVFPNSTLFDDDKVHGSAAARRRAARRAVAVEIRSLHAEIPPLRPALPVQRPRLPSTASSIRARQGPADGRWKTSAIPASVTGRRASSSSRPTSRCWFRPMPRA